jgi:hypothetical protein
MPIVVSQPKHEYPADEENQEKILTNSKRSSITFLNKKTATTYIIQGHSIYEIKVSLEERKITLTEYITQKNIMHEQKTKHSITKALNTSSAIILWSTIITPIKKQTLNFNKTIYKQ